MDDQITRYTPLVRSIARRYPLPPGWERSDIEQEGYIGLMNGLRRYDPGGLHKTYAKETVLTFAIKTSIRKALRAELGSVPDEIETPDISDQPTIVLAPTSVVTPAWLNSRVTRPLPVLSLDEMPEIAVSIPGPSVEEQATLSVTLAVALDALNARQRKVIEMRYGLGEDGEEYLWREIAAEMGYSITTLRRAEQQALATLRLQLTPPAIQVLDEKRAARARKRAAAA